MRLVDFDPITRIKTEFEYDHSQDKFVVKRSQDVDAILEDNKLAQLDVDSHRKQSKNDWSLYARVPNILIEKWLTEHGVDFFNPDHWQKVMRLINSPDYAPTVKRTTYYHDR